MVVFKRIIVVCLLSLVVLLAGCEKDDKIKIGITQFIDHDALDRAREGFIKALEDRGFVDGENIKIEYQSAQGVFADTKTIADTFITRKVKLIYAIATPSAQGARNATIDKNIPVLFSAVTDPVGAGLLENPEKPGTNISGTSDMSPMDKQFDLIRTIMGTGKTIGVLYSTGEQNSIVQVDAIRKEAGNEFTIDAVGIADRNALLLQLPILLDRVDALLIPTDNLMAANMETISSIATEAAIPVFGTESNQVTAGALMTEGIDYYDLGYQTGQMAADILEGKTKISEMAVELSEVTELIINLDTAKALGLTIPKELLDRAILIEDGEVKND